MKGTSAVLEDKEHHHLSKVVRLRPPDKAWLFDEHGSKYLARVEQVDKERTRLRILEKLEQEETKIRIFLAQALVRSKKMDLILHTATELGIAAFIPVITARSVAKIEERSQKKVERWSKIVRESSKQCKSGFMPKIFPPISLPDFLLEEGEKIRLYLSENRGKHLKELLTSPLKIQRSAAPSEVIILVGPEGGWTQEEEEMIVRHGYEAVSLGKNILRAETASLAAVAIISHFWNW